MKRLRYDRLVADALPIEWFRPSVALPISPTALQRDLLASVGLPPQFLDGPLRSLRDDLAIDFSLAVERIRRATEGPPDVIMVSAEMDRRVRAILGLPHEDPMCVVALGRAK